MYMPGKLKKVIKDQEQALKVINERKEIFSVDVKEHINLKFLNDVVDLENRLMKLNKFLSLEPHITNFKNKHKHQSV
jgi:hypothetical protein